MTHHDHTAETTRAAVTGQDPIRFDVKVERTQNMIGVQVTASRRGISAKAIASRVDNPGTGGRDATRIATEEACNLAVEQVLGAELAIAHVMSPSYESPWPDDEMPPAEETGGILGFPTLP